MALKQTTKLPAFGRGSKATYDAYSEAIKANMIYFATDEQIIYMNGIPYDAKQDAVLSGKIAALDAATIGGTGKVVTSVTETDGIISGTVIDLTTANVSRTATAGTATAVALSGTTSEESLIELATYIKSLQATAATYTIKQVSGTLASNVKEAYQMYQTIDGTETSIGVQIPVYKDSAVQSAQVGHMNDTIDASTGTITSGDGDDCIEIVYLTVDGTYDLVKINVADFLRETEFGNGLEVVSGKVQGKVDSTSEEFLTVSENGFKVSGVSGAINSQVTTAVNDLSGNILDKYNTLSGAIANAISGVAMDADLKALSGTVLSNYNILSGAIKDTNDKVNILSGDVQLLSGTVLSNYNTLSGAIKDTNDKVDVLSGDVQLLSGTVLSNYNTLSGAIKDTNDKVDVLSGDVQLLSGTVLSNYNELSGAIAKSVSGVAMVKDLKALSGTVLSNYNELSGAIKDTNDKVDVLSGDVQLLSGTVLSNYNALSGSIKTTNDKVDNLSGDVALLSGTVLSNYNTLSGAIAKAISGVAMDADLKALSGTVLSNYNILSGAIKDTNDKVDVLSGDVQLLSGTILSNYNALSGAIKDTNDKVDNLSGDVQLLSGTVLSNYNTLSGAIANALSGAKAYTDEKTNNLSGTVYENEITTAAALINLDDRVTTLENNTADKDAIAALSGIVLNNYNTLSGSIKTTNDKLDNLSGNVDVLSGIVLNNYNTLSGAIDAGDQKTLSGSMYYTDNQIALAFGWYEETT